MAKETFYFQHDYNARNDDKVLELRSRFGGEGYGIFWMIIETMAENEHGGVKASLMGGLSQGYGVAKGWLSTFFTACVEIGLFYEESGTYYSKRLLTHKEFRRGLSESGSAGAKKRWGNYSLPNSLPNGDPNAKERKGKDIKGENTGDNAHEIKKSHLFKEPTIPTKQQVMEAISKAGGTKEMAKSFWEKHESTGWYMNGSPIVNYTALASRFVTNWKANDEKEEKKGKQEPTAPTLKILDP